VTRYRVTVRGEGIELRGFVDEEPALNTVAAALPTAMVVASPAEQAMEAEPDVGTAWNATWQKR
jgi:hypothetical protein